jgi:hypothetical protein
MKGTFSFAICLKKRNLNQFIEPATFLPNEMRYKMIDQSISSCLWWFERWKKMGDESKANLIDGGSEVDEKEGGVLVWFERAKVEHRVALVAANLNN